MFFFNCGFVLPIKQKVQLQITSKIQALVLKDNNAKAKLKLSKLQKTNYCMYYSVFANPKLKVIIIKLWRN